MRFSFFLYAFSCVFFTSCQVFTAKETNTFSKDSEFLKNGNIIKPVEKKKVFILKELKPKPVEKEKVFILKEVKPKTNDFVVEQKKVKETKKETQVITEPVVVEKDKIQKKDYPFKVGEEVVLSAQYFGVEAGKVSIGVLPMKKMNDEDVYHFYAFGKTSSLFSLFYSVKDRIESLWSPKIERPLSLAFDAKETKEKYKIRVYFDWKKKVANFFEEGWNKKKGNYKDEKKWKLPNLAQDIVSSIFFTRTLPLEVGKSYTFNVFENAKNIKTTLKVDRKETIKTRKGPFKTLVLKPSFISKGKFKKVGDISIWLTDDEYRQVIRIEMKIKIGTVVASLYDLKRPK